MAGSEIERDVLLQITLNDKKRLGGSMNSENELFLSAEGIGDLHWWIRNDTSTQLPTNDGTQWNMSSLSQVDVSSCTVMCPQGVNIINSDAVTESGIFGDNFTFNCPEVNQLTENNYTGTLLCGEDGKWIVQQACPEEESKIQLYLQDTNCYKQFYVPNIVKR
ncbi:hypothetical protein LOTGIDRAFT_175792 [Lottia gigantea]|uniref:Sushi domain-containing protein n=1 Tax=Lottia gigantea TaxID=225164 RepID=V4BPZ0_LOTGI|nr:hypothetical protein LOTGIDRAFT_175792 [Lottia gigantea]ESO90914.1 hypothetical protein LOTGIDRAFT_175792 [Lottia gigantea]